MNLLQTLIVIVVTVCAFKYLMNDVYEGYCNNGSCDPDKNSKECNANVKITPKLGCSTSKSYPSMCGWNNSVTSDDRYNWAPDDLKGKTRVFKYPHYYGYGTGSGFHYGEPYYTRSVDY